MRPEMMRVRAREIDAVGPLSSLRLKSRGTLARALFGKRLNCLSARCTRVLAIAACIRRGLAP